MGKIKSVIPMDDLIFVPKLVQTFEGISDRAGWREIRDLRGLNLVVAQSP